MSFKEGRSEQGLLFFIRENYMVYYENNYDLPIMIYYCIVYD